MTFGIRVMLGECHGKHKAHENCTERNSINFGYEEIKDWGEKKIMLNF